MDLKALFKDIQARTPRFADGRIDYSKAKRAIVLTVFVRSGEEILLLKRSRKVNTYKGKWNTVAGYYDELVPPRAKALEELREETGIRAKDIKSMKVFPPATLKDPDIGTTWIIIRALVTLKRKPRVKLDFEHTAHRWIKPSQIGEFDTVPRLAAGFRAASSCRAPRRT